MVYFIFLSTVRDARLKQKDRTKDETERYLRHKDGR